VFKNAKRIYRRNTGKSISAAFASLTLAEMFERFMNVKRTEGLARKTIEDYETHFRYLMEYLENDVTNDQINIELFREYIDWMLNDRGLSPVTVNIRLRTMRAFLRFCHSEGYVETPIHEKLKLLKTAEDTLESLNVGEIKVLLKQVDTGSYVGYRDLVMICVLLDTMVRISELISMKRGNVDLKAGTIKLEAHETKTKRARSVPVSTRTIKLLADYLKETNNFYEDTLFLTYDGRPILANTWRSRLSEYGEMAGISNKRVSPHTFRHTGALFYIMNGGDPFSLQKILGHSDMSMVRRYIQMTNMDVKRQHNVFSPLKNISF
jgi:integrase/recombinase XerD